MSANVTGLLPSHLVNTWKPNNNKEAFHEKYNPQLLSQFWIKIFWLPRKRLLQLLCVGEPKVNHQDHRCFMALAQAHDFILSNSVSPKPGIFTKDVFQGKNIYVQIYLLWYSIDKIWNHATCSEAGAWLHKYLQTKLMKYC